MLENLPLGIYLPGNSFVHRLQARTKLLTICWLIVILTVAIERQGHYFPYICLCVLTILAFYMGRLAPVYLLKRLRLILVTLVLGALSTVLYTSGTVLYQFGPFVLTIEGLWVILNLFTFFVILYALTMLLSLTTSPVALVEGLTILLKPFRRLHLPIDDFVLMTLISLRFIPTILEEAKQLYKAQISRGANLNEGNLFARVQSVLTLIVPLIKGALRRAELLEAALEVRGYQFTGQQTLLHEKSLTKADYLTLAIVVITMSLSLLF